MFMEGLEARQVLSAMAIIDPPGSLLDASTFPSGSFQVTNTSTTGQKIDRVEFDLSSSIFPDLVFDPFGLAGDPVGKELTIDSEGGTGFSSFQYLGPHAGGFDALEILFTDFDPGETVTFSIDNDPTSIQGLPQPGPNNSGSISGVELVGTQLTVDFDDASSLTETFYRIPGSIDGSQVFVESGLPAQPTIEVLGVGATPTTVASANQTVRVSGPAGSEVSLLIVEGALYDTGGGFDLDPYEANTAVAINELTATIGGGGTVDIPVTLTTTNASAGVNHIVATLKDGSGKTGPLSSVEVLQLGGTEKIQFTQASNYTDAEGAGTSTEVQLVRTGDVSGASQVQVNITGGTATVSADYDGSAFPLVVDFLAGETSKTINLPIVQDSLQEVDETVTFSVTAITSVTIGENSTATLEIIDDDTLPSEIRINAGGPDYTDGQSQLWQADAFFDVGTARTYTDPITGTTDDPLFQTERYGNVSYAIPVVNAVYDVNLSFAELFWTESGRRVFDVIVEGQPLIDDLDIFDQVGHDAALTQSLTGISVNDGTLNIQFVTITDNAKLAAIEIVGSAPRVEFSQSGPYQENESAGSSTTVMLTRTGDTSGTSEVSVSITGGTATPGSDYSNGSFPLPVTFGPGETAKPVTIPITQDSDPEGTEDITLEVTAVSGVVLGSINTATLQIIDDDVPPDVEFSQAAPYLDGENTGNSTVMMLTRSGDLSQSTDVQVSITGGTATAGVDYDGSSFPLVVSFGVGETTKPVSIPILQDGDEESDETITFEVTSVTNAAIGAINTATLEILDDDGGTVLRVNAGGPAFTDGSGNLWQADSFFTGGTTHVSSDPIAGTLDDTLYQSERYGNVDYAFPVLDGIYDVTLKFAEVFWTEAGRRSFDVNLEGQQVIDDLDLFDEVGHDVAYDQVFAGIDVSDGFLDLELITVANNAKIAAIEITPSTARVEFSQTAAYQDLEGAGSSTVVMLTRVGDASGTSDVLVNITGGSATAGSDYDATTFPLPVSFGPGETTKPVTIPILQDTDQEGVEDILFSVTAVSNAVIGTTNTATLEIVDDDTAPTVEFSQTAAYQEPESVGTSTVILLTRSGDTSGSSDVLVSITGGTASAGSDYNATSFPLPVTFGPGETSKPVTIPIISDTVEENTEDITFDVTSVTNAAIGAVNTATLEILDDDGASTVRINAGGLDYVDGQSQLWSADVHFSGGTGRIYSNVISGTPDQPLYQSERYGNLTYDIPVTNSTYNVNLKFAEVFWQETGRRVFDVVIEGQSAIDDLDIFAQVGVNAAYDEMITGVEVTDGELNIELITEVDNAKLAAIEILPGTPTVQFSQSVPYQDGEEVGSSTVVVLTRGGDTSGTSQVEVQITGGTATAGADYDGTSFPLLVTFGPSETSKPVTIPILQDPDQEGTEDITFQVTAISGGTNIGPNSTALLQIIDDEAPVVAEVRVNAGGGTYVDLDTNIYSSDQFFTGGSTTSTTAEIFKTEDDALYQTERVGSSFGYEIPIGNGNYIVNLHFSENVHDDFGERVFDVQVEGQLEVDDLDIYARSINAFFPGKNSALVVTLPQVSITDETLSLQLTSSIDVATISAIEAIPLVGPFALLSQTNSETVVAEGGAGDTYSLVLNSEPTHDVTIAIQAGSQLTASTTSVTFTPLNYDIPQVVTLDAVNDSLPEGTQTVAVTHTVTSVDPAYDGIDVTPELSVKILDDDVPPVEFSVHTGASTILPTTATWGPDGRLYVGHVTGEIKAFTFDDTYTLVATETISTIQGLSNPNILGLGFSPFDDSAAPTLYVSHAQLFANGGGPFPETELSPYSGQVTVLEGPSFSVIKPLITGLPTSNHDHGINGLAFDNHGDLYVAVGGNTNAGVTHGSIGGIPESPFSAAVLKATITDPSFNGVIEYELPPEFVPPAGLTFPPETSQVWGGIASVAPGVDVSIFSDGLRNPYDLVWTTSGRLYATDNGPNDGFGNASTGPTTEIPAGAGPDELNLLFEGDYYGHPNRNRGLTDPTQYVYYHSTEASIPGVYTAPLALAEASTNGLDEYRATTFGGQLRGSLIAQQWNDKLYNWTLSPDGQTVVNAITYPDVANGLDVLTGPGGAILGIDYAENQVTIAQPVTTEIDPIAYDIFPWRASELGGNSFVIGGENFGNLGNTTVTIGGISATLTAVSSSRIKGILPAFPVTGTLLDVSVTSAGTNSLIPDAFMALAIPPAEVAFSQSAPFEDGEGVGTSIAVTLNRGGDTSGTSVVEVAITGGSAIPNFDFDATVFPQTVTFGPGETTQTVMVPILQDSQQEGTEDITFEVTLVSGVMIGTRDTATLEIIDDDPPTVEFAQSEAFADDEDTGISNVVMLLRSGDTTDPTTVEVSITGGTASLGADFDGSAFPMQVTFASGESSKPIPVPIVDDALDEPVEDITFDVTVISNANLGSNDTATLEILDNDGPSVVRINAGGPSYTDGLSQQWLADVHFTGGTAKSFPNAIAGTDDDPLYQSERYGNVIYNIPVVNNFYDVNLKFAEVFWTAPGIRLFDINIEGQQVVDDLDIFAEVGADTAFDQLISGIEVTDGSLDIEFITVGDNAKISAIEITGAASQVEFSQATNYVDFEGIGTSTAVTILRTGDTSGSSQVQVNITGGTAAAGSDYDGTSFPLLVNFGPGETTQTVPVPIINDTDDEADENITFSLSGSSIGAQSTATLEILDDDPTPTVEFSQATPYSDLEGVGTSTSVTLTRTGDTSITSRVQVSVTGGTATGGGTDYDDSSLPLLVTFDPGETSKTVSIPVVQDSLPEGTEDITFNVSPVFGALIGSTNTAVLEIIDDEVPPSVEFSQATAYQDSESVGTSLVVTLIRSGNTTGTSEVDVSLPGGGTATPTVDFDSAPFPLRVTFGPGETSKQVPITILPDTDEEGNETIMLDVSAVSGTSIGSNIDATLIIVDDDPPTVEFAQASFSDGEGAGTSQVVTLTRSGDTTNSSQVEVTITGGTATGGGTDYDDSTFPLTVTFNAGETSATVSLPIVDDGLNEGTETVTFSVASVSNSNIGSTSTTSLDIVDNDGVPNVEFSQVSYSDNEDVGTSQVVTLTRTGDTSGSSQVEVTITGGTATGGGTDYDDAAFPLTVTFNTGETSKQVAIPVIDDTLDETDETVTLAVSSISNATIGTNSATTLQILDDDLPATVEFSSASYSSDEDVGTSVAVTLNRTGDTSAASQVEVTITGGTATGGGTDYDSSAFPLTVSFAIGETTQTVSLPIVDDSLDESDETVLFAVSSISNAVIGTVNSTTLQITDNDSPATVEFSQASYSTGEDSGTSQVVTLTRSGDTSSSSQVEVTITGGTATGGGTDYDDAAFPLTVTFNAGETSQQVPVPVVDDSLNESDETITFAVSSVSNAVIGATNASTLQITDNDDAPSVEFSQPTYNAGEDAGTTVVVTLNRTGDTSASSQVEVAITGGTATGGGTDYDDSAFPLTVTFNAGETTATVPIPIVDDTVDDDAETIALSVSSISNAVIGTTAATTLTIDDNDPTVAFSQASFSDAEGAGTTQVVTLTRSGDASGTSQVEVTITGGTATGGGTDYDDSAFPLTITFNPGETSKPVPVPIVDDTIDDEAETITFEVSSVSNANIGGQSTATLQIDDDDPTVAFTTSSYNAAEDAGTTQVVTLTRTGDSSGSSQVLVSITGGTATGGSDYDNSAFPLTVTFNAGETSKAVPIPITDDTVDDEGETINLSVSSVSNATIGSPAATTLTIDDNDPTVAFSQGSFSTTEDAGTSTEVTLVRTGDPSGTSQVQVTITGGSATGGGTDYDDSSFPLTVTFNAGETSKTVPIPIVDDTLDESNETITFSLSSVSNATLGTTTSALEIQDNDDQFVEFSQASVYQDGEAAGNSTVVMLNRSGDTSGSSDVLVTITGGSATGGGTDYTSSSFPLTVSFGPGETSKPVTVPIVQDTEIEIDEDITFAVTAITSGVTIGSTNTATLQILDDDPAAGQGPPGVTRVNVGGPRYIDGANQLWLADDYYTGGSTLSTTDPIAGTSDDLIYQTQRQGNFSYSVPTDNGSYLVGLRFAEIVWTQPAERVFHVKAEGNFVIANLDVASAVGTDTAHTRWVFGVVVADSHLDLEFVAATDVPAVAGIEAILLGAGLSGLSPALEESPSAEPDSSSLVDEIFASDFETSELDTDAASETSVALDVTGVNDTTFRWVGANSASTFRLPQSALADDEEQDGFTELLLSRLGDPSAALEVELRISSESSSEESTVVVAFAPGETERTVQIPLLSDGVLEISAV